MFREMRRKNQALPASECEEILNRATSGTLALSGDGGYPYAVPISYVYSGGKLYFHCAKSGHKIDAIKRESKASFCVIDKDTVMPEEFTTYYRSVIVFGNIHIIEDESEMRRAVTVLSDKYCPVSAEMRDEEIDRTWARLCMLCMDIEHMTGKQARELVK